MKLLDTSKFEIYKLLQIFEEEIRAEHREKNESKQKGKKSRETILPSELRQKKYSMLHQFILKLMNSNNPDDIACAKLLKLELKYVRQLEKEKLKKIIKHKLKIDYVVGEYTLNEVGIVFNGLSRERIRQIEASVTNRVKHPTSSRKLRNYIKGVA